MRSNMIINGEMLAEYLDTIKFKKDEFVDLMKKSHTFTVRTKEDGWHVAYTYDEALPSNLFAERVSLNYDQSKRLLNIIGADVAERIIDWEAMGMINPVVKQLYDMQERWRFFIEPRTKYAY